MSEDEVLAYVRAAAVALGLPLDAQRAEAVAQHLARTAALARQLEAAGLSVDDEPAEIFRPAPFPAADEEAE